MVNGSALGVISQMSAASFGVFRGASAVARGVSRKQIGALRAAGLLERVLPDVYRMTGVPPSNLQSVSTALLWAGKGAAAAGHSAGELYGLEGIHAPVPEIVVLSSSRARSDSVVVHRAGERAPLLLRLRRGLLVTGVEPTLLALAQQLDAEAFEIACEDARRRRLTSVAALRAYLARFASRRT